MAIKERNILGSQAVIAEAERHLRETQPVVALPRYAGFWRRVAATLVDSMLLSVATGALTLVTVLAALIVYAGVNGIPWTTIEHQYLTLPSQPAAATLWMNVCAVALTALAWLYYTWLESSAWGATVGKRLMGLRVTDEAGGRISLARANARYWSKILSAVLLSIGFLMAAFTARKQALHDLIAHTLVVLAW